MSKMTRKTTLRKANDRNEKLEKIELTNKERSN